MLERRSGAQRLARSMLLREAGAGAEPSALAEAADRVNARLRGRLASVIGLTGYTVLVARAVRLAQAELPALEQITVNTLDTGVEGGLHGVHAFVLAHDGEQGVAEAGLIVMLGTVIELLSTFIGEDLAFHLVRDAWPELADDQANRKGQEGQP
jgi:hypothetical protein